MKPILFFCLILALPLLAANSAAAAVRQQLHGHMPPGVARLQPLDRLPPGRQLNLTIGLPLRNRETLTNLLEQIYDPTSTNYHHYLTADEFAARFGPIETDYQALIAFAQSNQLTVTTLHSNRTLVAVRGSVANIERAFHLHLRVYKHPVEARSFFAPDAEPSLDLATPVLSISGMDDFVIPHPANLDTNSFYQTANATALTTGSGPRGNFIGRDFRAAYAPGVSLDGSGQVVGLFELDGYYPGDITEYESIAGLPNVALTNVLIDGFNGSPAGNNIEVALDIDMTIAMAPGLSRVIVYEGFSTDNILNRMATDNLARQLSSSWTFTAVTDPVREQIFQQFAAQGQSFFESSGDSGAYIGTIPAPADEPFATIVGGTSLTTAGQGGPWLSETTWPGSGGGISTSYAIPVWQQGVSMALNHGSVTKRNIPDVACLADAVIWVVANNGQNGATGGTSAATPLWAGFVALVNQQAAANGQPSVGFLNPAIYAIGGGAGYGAAFHDITTGNNFSPGSGTNFSAVPGYDLTTGWGSPTGSNLIAALLAPADALQITPAAGAIASGPAGGPFNPSSQNYSLTNFGSSALNWSLANLPPWLSASSTNGALTPGGAAATVTVSLNAAASNLAAGSYLATLWFTNLNNGFAQSRLFTLAVIMPPLILAQPANQSLPAGATATFTVSTAANAQMIYQWRQNTTNLTDGGNFFGSATPTLTISNILPADAAAYSVIVSNSLGSQTSSNALLTVISSKPVITVAPMNQTALPGSTVIFSVTAVGDQPLFYQWQQNQTNLTDTPARSGSTNSVLMLGNVSSRDAGTYSVIISNALGTATGTATLSIIPVTVSNTDLTTLYSFSGGNDGANPNELTQLANGNFYSTTQFGGVYGAGTIFQMTPGGAPATLYSFTGTNDGANSFAALAQGADGNLYGTTFQGGLFDNGTLFNVSTTGVFNIVTPFTMTNGDFPFGKLVRGPDGSLYGTTYQGGASGHGTIFRLATNNVLTTIYSFTGGGDGGFPHSPLALGADGNFYGTTFAGGNSGVGTVFKVATNGTLTSLLSFAATNGANPYAGLVAALDGNFYGVTANGGAYTNGVLFKITPGGVILNQYSFTGGSDGANPAATLLQAADGNFYGTTPNGGTYGDGTLFRLTPDFVFTNLAQFDGFNGANPQAALTQGLDGNLYGVTPNGGASGRGNIFRFSIQSPPQITSQPANRQVFVGSTTTFSVAVFGAPLLTYQWLKNGVALSDGGNVAGSSTPNLTLDNVTMFDTAIYSVLIHNPLGTATSRGAFLDVVDAPLQIVTQPTNLTLSPGATANFSVGVTGDQPYFFQWQINGINLTNGGAVSGATTTNLTITNVTEANNGAYSVLVSNTLDSVTSSNAILAVIPTSTAGTRLTGLRFFAGGSDGSKPSRLTLGTDGNLYGTTQFGGSQPGTHGGTVFRVSTNGTVTNLAGFGAATGFGPTGGVVQGLDGNFYGTTEFGGSNSVGNIFRMSLDGTLTNIYSFTGGVDGYNPIAPLVRGPDGNFYGSTQSGGDDNDGNIFCVTPDGRLTNLYSFTNGIDGGFLTNALTFGADGNLYGVTPFGGASQKGSVFRLTTNGVFSTVYSFTGMTDGSNPNDLLLGADGSFYGTTKHSMLRTFQFYGVVFNLTTNGAFNILYTQNAADGHNPAAGLVAGNDGNFYGTCEFGGTVNNNGTVFRITAGGAPLSLVNFDGSDEGAHPETPLTLGADGNLYGTTSTGGPGGSGTIFRLSATNAPQITTQPAPQTAFVSSTVKFSVAVFGAQPLYYQWQLNSNNLVDGGNISGSSSRVLTLSNVAATNAGSYSVIITNALGQAASSGALLSLLPQPRFQSVVRTNNVFSFTWSAVTGHNYQVQFNPALGTANWTNLGGIKTGINGTVSASDTNLGSQRFYRLLTQ